MSLRAKIEAVIYAAEEPVTLAQLAAIFVDELPDQEIAGELTSQEASEAEPSAESLIEQGFLSATNYGFDADMAAVALREGAEQREHTESAIADPAASRAAEEAPAKRIARLRDREVRDQLKAIVDSLIEEYAHGDRGMEIREVASGYRIATKPEYHDAVRSFVKRLKPPMKLSLQALETLAVIAYKQPVTAPEVSEIRGVESGGVLGTLVSRKLITTAGRKQVIGRPILYKTTREFLLRFGLKDINELPSIEEFEKLAGDLEIGEEETGAEESALPFDVGETGSSAVEANAGESGVAVESAIESTIESAIESGPETASRHLLEPQTVALDTKAPETTVSGSIEVTPASHPSVPLEEIEVNDGRTS